VTIRGSVSFSAAAVCTSLYDRMVTVVELFVGACTAVEAGAVAPVVLFASDTLAAAGGTVPATTRQRISSIDAD
jgi:hypothetical protein